MKKFETKRLVVLSTVAAVGLSATQIVVKSEDLADGSAKATAPAKTAPAGIQVADRTIRRRDRG